MPIDQLLVPNEVFQFRFFILAFPIQIAIGVIWLGDARGQSETDDTLGRFTQLNQSFFTTHVGSKGDVRPKPLWSCLTVPFLRFKHRRKRLKNSGSRFFFFVPHQIASPVDDMENVDETCTYQPQLSQAPAEADGNGVNNS